MPGSSIDHNSDSAKLNPEPRNLKENGSILTSQFSSLTTQDSIHISERSSYRQIFKATSIFGGVQVFQILIGIVRVKFVAVLLGTAGVGIMGLLNAPIQLIISITGFGIAFSAVREISEAHANNNQLRIAVAITTLRRWSWFTGLLGAVVTITLAPLLSQWTFGNKEYKWAFFWLSFTLLLLALSNGQKTILQGTRRLKDMAKAGLVGSVTGLITSVPLYYMFGIKGIVPAMIITAVTTLLLSWTYSSRVKIKKIVLSSKETFHNGLGMSKLGLSMTLAGLIASLASYILNSFISNRGGVDQVGLYNAGRGVVGQYTGIIFTSMATDYFPRLSAIHNDNKKVKELVSQQAETALLIITPLLTLLIVTMPVVIRAIYTSAFLPIVMFANITVLGMQLKTVSWAMGYIYLAKGNGRLFIIMEIISGTAILLLNLLFYYLYGLNGLGISFVISFLLSTIFSYSVLKLKYGFCFPTRFYRIFIATYGFILVSFLTVFIPNVRMKFLAGILVFVLISIYSLMKLNKLIDMKSYFKDKFIKTS